MTCSFCEAPDVDHASALGCIEALRAEVGRLSKPVQISDRDSEAIAAYWSGVRTGVMKHATPNVVRHLLTIIGELRRQP